MKELLELKDKLESNVNKTKEFLDTDPLLYTIESIMCIKMFEIQRDLLTVVKSQIELLKNNK